MSKNNRKAASVAAPVTVDTVAVTAPAFEVIAGGTIAPVETVTTNTSRIDMVTERKNIETLRSDFQGNVDRARAMAVKYVLFAIDTSNCDLIRHLWEALPAMYQPRLARWVKHVAPIEQRRKSVDNGKGQKLVHVSFGKDKARVDEKGWRILDHAALDVAFDTFKPDAKAKTDPEAADLFAKLVKACGKLEESAGTIDAGLLLKAKSILHDARVALEACVRANPAPDAVNTDLIVRRDTATTPTPEATTSDAG